MSKHKPSKHKRSHVVTDPEIACGPYRYAALVGLKWVSPHYNKPEPTQAQVKAAMALSKAMEASPKPPKET